MEINTVQSLYNAMIVVISQSILYDVCYKGTALY